MWKASLLYAKWQFNWNAKLLIELCIANRRQFQVTEASSLEVDKSYKFYKIFLCDIYYWPELLNFIFLYSVDKDTGILKRLFNEKWYLVIFRSTNTDIKKNEIWKMSKGFYYFVSPFKRRACGDTDPTRKGLLESFDVM